MKPPIAFLSYDFRLSESERARFVDDIGMCSQAFTVDDWSSERRGTREDWDKHVHSKIGRCDFLIVLVADGMELAPVAVELQESRRCNVPFFGVYVGAAKSGTPLPDSLRANRTIEWDWDRIAVAIAKVMREGKHHVFK